MSFITFCDDKRPPLSAEFNRIFKEGLENDVQILIYIRKFIGPIQIMT